MASKHPDEFADALFGGRACCAAAGRLQMTFPRLGRLLLLAAWAMSAHVGAQDDLSTSWRTRFTREVDRRLEVPAVDQRRYVGLLDTALAGAGLPDLRAPAVRLVDRRVRFRVC